jgi:hypothetical protein
MGDLSAHFSRSEFACQCGCGADQVSSRLLEALETMRESAKRPLTIRSGCRCPNHNQAEGGKVASAHITTPGHPCEAADLETLTSRDRYQLLRAALAAGCTRIGIGRDFLHMDVDALNPQEVAWLY